MAARLLTLVLCLAAAAAGSGSGPEECGSAFLVLDLDGNGLRLSDRYYPVDFDVDGDGEEERLSWTAERQNDAFLWLDQNDNGQPDGREIFGSPALAPDSEASRWGFAALEAYDLAEAGGNGDGWISEEDSVWRELRLWIDRNHDARAGPGEVDQLEAWKVEAISLDYEPSFVRDASFNLHRYWSTLIIAQDSRNIRYGIVTEICFDFLSESSK